MREITSHRVNPANDKLAITVVDEPGAGGANHAYLVHGYDDSRNASVRGADAPVPNGSNTLILFQNGPIAEAGVNGLTQEALLAVLIDRLEAFQSGQFANDYNAAALDHLRSAQGCLFARTQERMSRGVEGTHKA